MYAINSKNKYFLKIIIRTFINSKNIQTMIKMHFCFFFFRKKCSNLIFGFLDHSNFIVGRPVDFELTKFDCVGKTLLKK